MSHLKALHEWYQSPMGQRLLSRERAALSSYFSKWSGEYALQIGGMGGVSHLSGVSVDRVYGLSDQQISSSAQMIDASVEELPLLPESLDLIVVPHVLEWLADPRLMLQQIERSLAEEGYLVVYHFNPWNLSGLSRMWKSSVVPWSGRWFGGYRRMRRCFVETGMMCVHRQCIGFGLTQDWSSWGISQAVIETLGRCVCSRSGISEYTIWQKKVLADTLVRSKIAKRRWVDNSALTPTRHVSHVERNSDV